MNTIYFLGSKQIGAEALQFLIDHAQQLNSKVIGVLSNARKLNADEQTVVEIAQAHQIPVIDGLAALEAQPAADYIISVQYHQILQPKHIQKAKTLAVNLHMAPVPEYRGCNQFSFAVLDGATTFGTTLHELNASIDAGDVLFEDRFEISPTITAKELHALTEQRSIALFKQRIGAILSGNYTPITQAELAKTRPQGFYLRSAINHIKQVELHWADAKIDAHIRATYFPPFPGPFVVVDGIKHPLTLNWKQEIEKLRTH